MSRYTVEVTVIAKHTYTVEVDATTEVNAERIAASQWRDQAPEDFQVEKGYIDKISTEATQRTAECPDCGEEHDILHDDLRTCYCEALGHNLCSDTPSKTSPNGVMRPHVIVDGACVAAPWWHEDQDYCAACGERIEASEKNS